VVNDHNIFSSSWVPQINTWYHIAVTRNGPDLRFFINGIQLGITHNISTLAFFNSTQDFYIASYGGIYSGGYVDNVRVVKDKALWTSNFNLTDQELFYQEGTLL